MMATPADDVRRPDRALLEDSASAPDWPTDEEFDLLMRTQGWVKFPRAISIEDVEALVADCHRVYEICRSVQVENGVDANMLGAAHHVAGYGGPLDRFLDQFPLYDQVERYFAGKFILLNFGAALHMAGGRNYTFKPHRDVRAFSGDYRLSLNMLVFLSDFTVENGATLVLSGSHRLASPPSLEFFMTHAKPVTGRAGDIVLFDSLLVHSAAPNTTTAGRPALTLCLGRPFMKPQMDWPRFLPDEFARNMSPRVRQLMGFNARVASTLAEYYQPAEHWTFKADQI